MTTKVHRTMIRSHSENRKVPIAIAIDDKATKRVLAPFVRIVRKGVKAHAEVEESQRFSFYLEKKPSVLVNDLSLLLSDSFKLHELIHQSVDVLKLVTKACAASLYMIDQAHDQIYLSKVEPIPGRLKLAWKIKESRMVATYVAFHKECVLCDDIIEDKRFPEGVGYQSEDIKSVLCVPVLAPNKDIFAVLEFYRYLQDPPFTYENLNITSIVGQWMGAAIQQNQERLALQRQQELNDYLLDLTKLYFEEKVLIEKMISEVVKFAKVTIAAERGSFFIIIGKENDELIADVYNDESIESTGVFKKTPKVKLSRDHIIADLVAKTGLTVNLKDAYTDDRFNLEVDQKTGAITRSILCMPIMGKEGILGAVQVMNKRNGGCFTRTDEILFKTFTAYCALALHHTKTTMKMNGLEHMHNCYDILLKLQYMPCCHDYKRFVNNPKIVVPTTFDNFSYYSTLEQDNEIMPQLCLRMFIDLLDISDINLHDLMQFILIVKKLHRNNPFHNFEMSFNTTHTMYLIIKKNRSRFTKIEIKALLVATLCRNLDHRAYTNTFLHLINDDLCHIYDSCFIQNHIFDTILFILKDIHIFRNSSEYEEISFLNELKDALVSSDYEVYFKSKVKLKELLDTNTLNWKNPTHKKHIKGILTVGCALSGHCKKYYVAKNIARNKYLELYQQGDIEKQMGLCPLIRIDQENADLVAEDEIQYLDVVVKPCVAILSILFPNTAVMYEKAEFLRTSWQEVIEVRGRKCWRQELSLPVCDKKVLKCII